ncbi:hypothetical protein AURDEDRAFT_110201 [Auricularia subglabra TFB-10046 SS5]|nr:hypothetical protein AURDEDRAFT_110201 [Auricularia subglabra TFB-10046 SS5]
MLLRPLIALGLLALSVAGAPHKHRKSKSKRACKPKGGCFPNGNATLSDSVPSKRSRDDWWCPAETQYGFQGFSYPLEVSDCGDYSNSFEKIDKDFRRMKEDFGATLVRVYAPECREKSVWQNLLKAGVKNNVGVIGMVWWGFDDNKPEAWRQTRDSINAVLAEEPLAPYVFHSMAFGSEPIGDGVDGGGDNFVKDMKAWKKELAKYGIPIAMSEDWDRQGRLTQGEGLTDLGQKIKDTSDLLQLHPMPYYHCNDYPGADDVMNYFTWYIEKLIEPNFSGKQILITETQWASNGDGWHKRGCGEPGKDIPNFKKFWNVWQNNCEYWKEHKVGWFAHTFTDEQEPSFGILDNNGNPKMDFMPPKC